MKTYPIYEAKFSGSADLCRCVKVQIAAADIANALKRFKQWDECDTGTCGTVGRLVDVCWQVPTTITKKHIKRVDDLRATRISWYRVV